METKQKKRNAQKTKSDVGIRKPFVIVFQPLQIDQLEVPEIWRAEFNAFHDASWTLLNMSATEIELYLPNLQRSASLIPENLRLVVAGKKSEKSMEAGFKFYIWKKTYSKPWLCINETESQSRFVKSL